MDSRELYLRISEGLQMARRARESLVDGPRVEVEDLHMTDRGLAYQVSVPEDQSIEYQMLAADYIAVAYLFETLTDFEFDVWN